MTKKFTSTVAGASILLTGVGLLSRGLGLVRESIFANNFGLSPEYDLYLVSVVLPLTINTIILFLAQNFFIPVYHQKSSESKAEKKAFLSYSFFLFVSFGVLLLLVLFYFSGWFLKFYLSVATNSDSYYQAITIFKIYATTIPINAGFSLLAAYSQAEYNFLYPSLSTLLLNITVILMTLFFTKYLDILIIPFAYLLGICLQLIFLLIKTDFKPQLKYFIINSRLKEYFNSIKSSFVFIIIIEAVGQIYLISDRFFLNKVDSGGIAALNYGMILFNLPISIISVAFVTALFPSLSAEFGINNSEKLVDKTNQFFKINSFIFIPIAFCMYFWGIDFIRLFFERGKFGSADSIMTFQVLKIYSIGLVFYSSYGIINKLFYASQMIKYLLFLSLGGLAIKISLNFILVSSLLQSGLALSTSITYIFFFIIGSQIISSLLKLNSVKIFYSELFYNLINVILSAIILELIFFNIPEFRWLYLLKVSTFILIYLFNAYVINHEAIGIIKQVKKKIV